MQNNNYDFIKCKTTSHTFFIAYTVAQRSSLLFQIQDEHISNPHFWWIGQADGNYSILLNFHLFLPYWEIQSGARGFKIFGNARARRVGFQLFTIDARSECSTVALLAASASNKTA